MSRRALVLFLILPILLLAACKKQEPAPEPQPTEAPGRAILEVLEFSGTLEPSGVRICLDEGDREEIFVSDTDSVAALWNATKAMRADAETDEFVTDRYHYVEFLFPDNSALSIFFNGDNLDMNETCYTLLNAEEFWRCVRDMAEPAEG